MKKPRNTSGQTGAARADVHTRITEIMLSQLEKGVRPWVQPWSAARVAGCVSRPLRFNGEPYSGINVLLLWSQAMNRGFAAATWMTFRQALELGGNVRKGETGSMVVYANRIKKTETDANGDDIEHEIPFLKAYTVFNLEQIDGLPAGFGGTPEPPTLELVERLEHADAFFRATGATIRHGGASAFYAPGPDVIQMPPIEAFCDVESYYATLAHEEIHWTAPSHRLNRDLSRYSKNHSERAREELIAELGAAFLAADIGIVPVLEPRPDHASYLASWLEVLRGDRRFIVKAAAQAQRAVAYLHALQPSSGKMAA